MKTISISYVSESKAILFNYIVHKNKSLWIWIGLVPIMGSLEKYVKKPKLLENNRIEMHYF